MDYFLQRLKVRELGDTASDKHSLFALTKGVCLIKLLYRHLTCPLLILLLWLQDSDVLRN